MKERKRERKEPHILRNKDEEDRECDRKRREYENKWRQKQGMETLADKESRLLTRGVHLHYKGRDNYKTCRNIRQREQIQNETPDKGSKFCENEFRMKHL